MPMKGARSKVPLSGHFKWLSQFQDWFTKSGCHSRILMLETWNFVWDLVLRIHMLYKKRGTIWELFEKLAQPTQQLHPSSFIFHPSLVMLQPLSFIFRILSFLACLELDCSTIDLYSLFNILHKYNCMRIYKLF